MIRLLLLNFLPGLFCLLVGEIGKWGRGRWGRDYAHKYIFKFVRVVMMSGFRAWPSKK